MLGNNMFAYCNNNPVNFADPTGESITIATLILIGSAIIGVACAGYTAYVEYNAGFEPGKIIVDSFVAGMSAFMLTYSLGMTAYQCYQNFCFLQGLTPITNIGSNTTSLSATPTSQPAMQTNPLQNITYTDKVQVQMQQGDYHAFPRIVDNYGAYGMQTTVVGGDGNVYTKLMIPGAYDGNDGFFVYLWDNAGQCNHRLFEVLK